MVNELPMEAYLRGVVPAEVPGGLARGGAQGPVDRRPLVLGRPAPPGQGHVRRLRRHALAGLPRQERREAGDGRGHRRRRRRWCIRTPSGGIANAFFHSTGGGATENNEYAWVSSTGQILSSPYSYLRGSLDRRPDGTPYDANGPYAKWKTATYTLAQIRSWFADDSRTDVGTLVKLNLSNRGVSGRLISVKLIGADGTKKTVSGSVFISIFNAHRPSSDPLLRSTLFDLAPIS